MRFVATGLAALFALSPLATALAETRYVADVLVVDLRSEPRTSAPASRYLRTGDAMEVLDEEGNFLKVRTSDGTVGWVIQQYTTTETPKAHVIARLKAEVSRLKKRALEAEDGAARFQADAEAATESQVEASRRLQVALDELQVALDEARTAAAAAQEQLHELRRKYEQLVQTSQDAVQTMKERDRLKTEHQRMTETVQRLEQERDQRTRSNAIQWFLAGAGVLLVGWLLGASFRRKKKSGYSIA
jgi:SH3 domain protein